MEKEEIMKKCFMLTMTPMRTRKEEKYVSIMG
jgi:hypothetical protein